MKKNVFSLDCHKVYEYSEGKAVCKKRGAENCPSHKILIIK